MSGVKIDPENYMMHIGQAITLLSCVTPGMPWEEAKFYLVQASNSLADEMRRLEGHSVAQDKDAAAHDDAEERLY